MRSVVLIVAVAVILGACTFDASGDAFGADDLTSALAVRGADVTVLPFEHDLIGGVTGVPSTLCIDGREAVLLEYPDGEARSVEIPGAPPDVGRLELCWGTIGWWARGSVAVYYFYAPEHPDTVVPLLDDVLGPSLGRTGTALHDPPEEIPRSGACS